MIGLTTKFNHPELRAHLSRLVFTDDSNTSLVKEIETVCNTYHINSIALYVWMEVEADADLDCGCEYIMQPAEDFLFLQQLQQTRFIETMYTPISMIRMVAIDGELRLYWVDPEHEQSSVVLATWKYNGWELSDHTHYWMWTKVKEDLKDWLRTSFLKLKSSYSLTKKIN